MQTGPPVSGPVWKIDLLMRRLLSPSEEVYFADPLVRGLVRELCGAGVRGAVDVALLCKTSGKYFAKIVGSRVGIALSGTRYQTSSFPSNGTPR